MTTTTVYTIDTNILLKDYRAITAINTDIRIPLTVIREAENHKKDMNATGWNARKSLKIIESFLGDTPEEDVLSNGKKLIIDMEGEDLVPRTDINDDKIIQSALASGTPLITNDVAMRIIARAYGVKCKPYVGDEAEITKIGRVEEVHLDYRIIDQMYEDNSLPEDAVETENNGQNASFIFKDGTKSILGRRIGDKFQRITPPEDVYGMNGRNVAQRFYLDMLMDPKIKLLFATGCAGSGKTILALAAALQLKEEKRSPFKRIICCKSDIEMAGEKIGYLPGDIEDKIGPGMESFNDCLKVIMPETFDEKSIEYIPDAIKFLGIEFIPIGRMRGRTFSDSFIIADESQQMSLHGLKSIISRAGENSKIVCMGDLKQIDAPKLSQYNNGLYIAQKKLFDNEKVGIISLPKSERSDIAQLCAKL